ncbi:glycosyltransferase family 2 protein [Amycolatopsis sp. GM8]|uniref:glycosyltransferase family 2 protein n=1 Tax=Amycolatopsis sp. GM8 TaxID=2896530 RepID=UPI001F356EC2|nr:cellulose synthase catalytic subunit [Amycolatopsis sp. GM8]
MGDSRSGGGRAREWRDFSEIAGPISEVDDSAPYRVRFTNLQAADGKARFARSIVIAVANLLLEVVFFAWLLQPAHLPPFGGNGWIVAADVFVISAIALMELLRLVNVVSLSLASIVARDPVPVAPQQGLRVAFVTTIVPSKEPIDMVERTLVAAKRIRYQGRLDVWLLDEGDDPQVRAMCARLGVHHFSRKGQQGFNRKRGPFKAKTKHGNYNSWLQVHGARYAVMMSVDPDHLPLSNYAERILGYFRDPNVAYVVGPQCYANCDNLVTKAAESQQFPFHSVIQRAANRYGVAMLVGTNNAIRISAIQGVGGLSDSVTEDMATGLKIHTARNPETGRRWRSVYTPDVLAIGEGPSSWSDYFSQQLRWSRGTFEVLLGDFWRRCWRLSPGRLLHYALITTFYPSMALGWILGGINAVLFLAFGVHGIDVPVQLWLALYTDASAFQVWLYVRNRRHNVSPSELEGSSGARGMLMSVLTSPMYASSLIAALLRRPARFVVTAKGSSTSTDTWLTFRRHLQWAVVLVAALITSLVLGYATLESCLWPALSLLVCLVPIALWQYERRRPTTAEPQRGTPTRTELMRQETKIVEAIR